VSSQNGRYLWWATPVSREIAGGPLEAASGEKCPPPMSSWVNVVSEKLTRTQCLGRSSKRLAAARSCAAERRPGTRAPQRGRCRRRPCRSGPRGSRWRSEESRRDVKQFTLRRAAPSVFCAIEDHTGRIQMRICALACTAAIAAVPASAQGLGLVVDLLPGHPIYHESVGEAGVIMALSITPAEGHPADLKELCEDLRVAAGLPGKNSKDLPLEVIAVVPYKGMAIEGYYLPPDGTLGSEALRSGTKIARRTLDGIVARAGIPSHLLDETNVEHEIVCEMNKPAWLIHWKDVRLVNGEDPDTVIQRTSGRFMTIQQIVVEHIGISPSAHAQSLGSNRSASIAAKSAPAPRAVP
jgi:hypothetical protein